MRAVCASSWLWRQAEAYPTLETYGGADLRWRRLTLAERVESFATGQWVSVRRRFRITGKKKGGRQSGSRWLGGVGEVILFAVLALVGFVVAVLLIGLQITASTPDDLIPWSYFAVQLGVGLFLLALGLTGLFRIVWDIGASAERRSAWAFQARRIRLLHDVKPYAGDWPTVPVELAWTLMAGEKLALGLRSRQRPRWGLIASGVLSVTFVLITSIVSVMNYNDYQDGQLDVLGLILNVALVVASIWSFQIFVRQLLSFSGIGPTRVEVDDFPLRPGNTYRFRVVQFGRVRLKLLDVVLTCREDATFREGTDLRTESRVVFTRRLIRKRGLEVHPREPLEFEFELTLPFGLMHSFQADNNQILWSLSVLCTARGWPEKHRTYPLLVAPEEGGGAA